MKTRDALSSLLILPVLIACLVAAPTIARTVRPSAQFLPIQETINRALAWLHTQQAVGGERDGLIGTSSVSCDVARVVALAGEDPNGLAWTPGRISLLQRCQMGLPDIFIQNDAGATAKVLRTAIATGNNPRDFGHYDLIARVEAAYDPGAGLYHPKSIFRDTLAVLALQEAGRPVPDAAIQALLDQQNSDGCWGWPVGGDVTDTDTTGRVIEAIARSGQPNHPAVLQCIDTLIAHQLPDGGWEARWGDGESNSDSTALVIAALLAAGRDPRSSEFTPHAWNAVQALLSFQASDGSFWWKRNTMGTRLLGVNHALPVLIELTRSGSE